MTTKLLIGILGLAAVFSVGCGGGAGNSNNANSGSNTAQKLPEGSNVNLKELAVRTPNPTPTPNEPALPSDDLVGQWPGVDDEFLNLDRKGDKYWITIKGIEGIEMYEGTGKGKNVEFKRKNKTETIRKATPEETGMTWPEGETNCIVVTKGSEGYCKK